MIELIYLLAMTHVTIMSVTIYLHRNQAHRSVQLHPAVSHFMRFWLWLTTGMITQEWVAVHRQHHQKCDQPEDPHSPKQKGIWRVLFGGAWLYRQACQDRDLISRLSTGTPQDWIEQHVYRRLPWLGVSFLFLFNTAVFGWTGVMLWVIQMAWIPFWAAGVVNGLGHWWGYRNGNTDDSSTNICPWGIIIGGEELHNSHHLDPTNPKLSQRWFEFDIGWMYISVLKFFNLASVR